MPVGDLVGGRYRLESRIADGGMGAVWRGTDTRLGRDVAVKLLHPALSSDASFRARFASEARLVAALNTRSIATIHDYGEDEDDDGVRAYLVMEFVEGRSLADILRRDGALDVAEAMRIVAEAAEGLHAAHRSEIVHRDVKPANILITADGAVKLIDFGIARSLGDAGLTETGMVIGTVTYTAPEQLADEDPAPAADVYSLGIVAYECLTGTTPFASGKVPAIIHGHLNQPPPPLPENIPQAVSDAVMTALRKDPDDRWRSAERFARACREALDGVTPDEGAPPRPSYVAVMEALRRERPGVSGDTAELPEEEPRPKARPLVPALAALGIAVLLVGMIVWHPWSPPAVGDRAVREYHLPPLSSLTPGPDGEKSAEPGADASSGPATSPGNGDATGDDL
ncbi:MAG TPA: serine/threonine-protein kinase, partial [Phytomonospora sp.]